MKKVLITGVSGFVGSVLCKTLIQKGYHVKGIYRFKQDKNIEFQNFTPISLDLSSPGSSWSSDLLDGIDIVFHLAARVHIMNDSSPDTMDEYRQINTHSTRKLAELAVKSSVRRFIFMSTIKVNGEGKAEPYGVTDTPNPMDPYAISKWEAEQELNKISEKTGLETVILRSPLVYGPGVKANLLMLFKLVDQGIPLPLKNVKNQRSLIYLGNLVDALISCMETPNSPGNTFLVSDGQDLSTSELLEEIGSAMGKSPRLFPFPKFLLQLGGKVTGKSAWIERLLGTLTVDSQPIQKVLNWEPPFSLKRGMEQTAEWYVKSYKNRS